MYHTNKQTTNYSTKMAMTLELLVVRVEILEKQMAQLNIAKPDTKAKRTSGYLQYNSAHRAEVKAQLEASSSEKVKSTDVTKVLAANWKELSDEEREEWNNKAKVLKDSPEWLNQAAVAVKQVKLNLDFAEVLHENEEKNNAELKPEEINLDIEEEKPKKNKKEKKEKKEKENKPKKKRVSGYILFQKAMRDDVVQELKNNLQEEDAKIKQSDVMSELGKMWKALDDEEREEWNEKAAEQKGSDSEE